MEAIHCYDHPGAFLKANEAQLEQQEMENNLLLGNCYALSPEQKIPEGACFLDITTSEGKAYLVKISSKLIVSSQSKSAVEVLFNAYAEQQLTFQGVIGDPLSVEYIASRSGKEILQSRRTFIQSLSKVNALSLSQGYLMPARQEDLPLLSSWAMDFLSSERLFPARSIQETENFLKNLMKQGQLFTWVAHNQAVSMAAILRKTKHTAIIGYVYTPPSERGKGYAKSCMQQLSTHILQKGFSQSGLLVYESNKAAQSMYRQMGYRTVSELMDIDLL